jgi:hypothetical protein
MARYLGDDESSVFAKFSPSQSILEVSLPAGFPLGENPPFPESDPNNGPQTQAQRRQ